MNYEKRFNAIKDFLKEHEYLYQKEMLNHYPEKLKPPYHDWVCELDDFSFQDLLELESNYSTQRISDIGFIHFIKECEKLCDIPYYNTNETIISNELKRKLTPKKIHEIQNIKSYVATLKDINTIVDIGSGAGHLSCALVDGSDKNSVCIDMDKKLQTSGQKKINLWLSHLKDKIKFINHKVTSENICPVTIKDNFLVIGLHSCGALSTHIIKSAPQKVLNFSCCYHKLYDEYNLSKIAKVDALSFSNHALTMAAKCNSTYQVQDIEKKFLVKRFRYPIHFYYRDHFNQDAPTLGNAKEADYQGDFKSYINKYCNQLKDKSVELKSKQMMYYFKAGSIRALLGRLIEIYIILDRTLYLKEQGLDPKIYQFFNPKISPRNIGIIT